MPEKTTKGDRRISCFTGWFLPNACFEAFQLIQTRCFGVLYVLLCLCFVQYIHSTVRTVLRPLRLRYLEEADLADLLSSVGGTLAEAEGIQSRVPCVCLKRIRIETIFAFWVV